MNKIYGRANKISESSIKFISLVTHEPPTRLKIKRLKMMHDRVITISLDTMQCSFIGCSGIVFNVVTIDGVKFARCVNCGMFKLLTSQQELSQR